MTYTYSILYQSKDWYLDALNTKSWNECIARLPDTDLPVQMRPWREYHVNPNDNPCRSRRQKRQNKPNNTAQPSPSRRKDQREERRQRFNGPEGKGTDQVFRKLGLEPGSIIEEIDQGYCKLS